MGACSERAPSLNLQKNGRAETQDPKGRNSGFPPAHRRGVHARARETGEHTGSEETALVWNTRSTVASRDATLRTKPGEVGNGFRGNTTVLWETRL